ncbi:hypothetical protein SAMN05444156_1387 [Verrucomicrobium sp. GAS474]|uniref:hypothetical protein n=1 Tax=Verrucomicrobium sp. GAS474 TaxID=1882831 RepID=UPI0008793E8A|nr:hypothetical protein [Verrucomicrobium sp. GAS474]SDU00464.1 hypothetical protein SAMN05444156_1387 [Verrucomicrobium sp. GAS474]
MPRLPALLRPHPWLGGGALAGLGLLGLLFGILLVASLFPGFTMRQVARLLHSLNGQTLAFSGARWDSSSSLALLDVTMTGPDPAAPDPYFRAKRVEIVWNWAKLPTVRRLRLIELEEPEITVGKMAAAFAAGHKETERKAVAEADDDKDDTNPIEIIRHIFYKVRIIRGTVWLDNLAPGMEAIPLSIGGSTPLEWNTGSVSRAAAKENETQVAVANGVRLYARDDQLSPVLDLGHIEIHFTWAGLARQEIEYLSISDPTIYIGPRLFAFADEFKAHLAPATPAPTPAPTPTPAPAPVPAPAAADAPVKEWVLKDFGLFHLHLTITAFGEPGLALPLSFNSTSQNLSISQLSHLQFKNRLVISAPELDFPAYGVKLSGLDQSSGVEFNLPPQDSTARNLVETIKMKEASWKEIAAQDVWATVTFNREGIFGKIGGKFYDGYLDGFYRVGFGDGFPWHAGLYMSGSQAQVPVRKVAGEHFDLSGKVNAHVVVDARAREILTCEGELKFPSGGRLAIPSVAEVATRLPESWGPYSAQRQIVARVLESFENYPFDLGTVLLHYGVPTSTAELHLEGPAGKRNFVLNWKQENQTTPGFSLPEQKPPQISVQIDKPTTSTPSPIPPSTPPPKKP